MKSTRRCRCHSGRKAHRCCGPWLGGRPAPTPEALMRSRYAAYALGLADYIVATTLEGSAAWDPSPGWRDEIAAWSAAHRFVGLRILDAPAPQGEHATVTFEARLSSNGQPAGFVEQSRFVRRGDRWFYAGAA